MLHESIARYVQLCLNDLGIKVNIQPVSFNDLMQRYCRKADFQAVISEFPDVRNAMNSSFENLLYLNGKQAGAGSFANPQTTTIVNQISQETDPSRRKALLDELNSLLDSLQPASFLVQKTSLDVLSKRFIPPCELSNMYYQFKLWQVSPVSN